VILLLVVALIAGVIPVVVVVLAGGGVELLQLGAVGDEVGGVTALEAVSQ
jgi:ABC-type Na+ efflux pump permease subunit